MNLGDPELELIDPTPNVHSLFIHFDKLFFWAKLASRAVVRWSKRMYSCAGICSYEGRAGLCDIALSEPLLKLRPRKDLIETLLHEMIHAYLFITCQDRERDGHGPNFQSHMHRINKTAGLNISIYHDFHDEVKLYQVHWWRCDGPCQKRRPYFGIVRRTQNKAPGPSDFWWNSHQRNCGGKFIKIKEPEKKLTKKEIKEKNAKKNGDIKKYINNSVINEIRKPLTPIIKNVSSSPRTKITSNGGKALSDKNVKNSPAKSLTPITAFTGKGVIINTNRKTIAATNVNEIVRNVWANKQLPNLCSSFNTTKPNEHNKNTKPNKHKADPVHSGSPPAKIKKIDSYFKSTATSLLKDLYGEEFKLTQTNDKIIAVTKNLVDCPICITKIDSDEINQHLDECLNKDVIEKLSKDIIAPIATNKESSSKTKISNPSDRKSFEKIDGAIPSILGFSKNNNSGSDKMFKEENGTIKLVGVSSVIDLTNVNIATNIPKKPTVKSEIETAAFDPNDVNTVKAVVKSITYDKQIRKSDNFILPKDKSNEVDCGFLPSFLDDVATEIKAPPVKIEPGTSKDVISSLTEQKCPCCGDCIKKPMAEHLDECHAFNNTSVSEEGASTSFANNTIVIDDEEDDIFDETLTLNATGTKSPCPCCLEMIEMAEMNEHLDTCLS